MDHVRAASNTSSLPVAIPIKIPIKVTKGSDDNFSNAPEANVVITGWKGSNPDNKTNSNSTQNMTSLRHLLSQTTANSTRVNTVRNMTTLKNFLSQTSSKSARVNTLHNMNPLRCFLSQTPYVCKRNDVQTRNTLSLMEENEMLKRVVQNKDKEIADLKRKRESENYFSNYEENNMLDEVPKKVMKVGNEKSIDDFINSNKGFSKTVSENGFIVTCNICKDSKRPANHKLSLAYGLEFTGLRATEAESGSSKTWSNLRRTLYRHMTNHNDYDDCQLKATKNIISVVLTSIKLKCANHNFSNLLAMAKTMGVDVGSKCHSRKQMIKLTKSLRLYAFRKMSTYLKTPLERTSLPPHFSIAVDRTMSNKHINQVVMIILRIGGVPTAVPIDCTLISEKLKKQMAESHDKELADIAIKILKGMLDLTIDDFRFMTTVYADGNKYTDEFYLYLKETARVNDDSFFFNISDTCEWIDSAVRKVWHSLEFFDDFVKRCHKFQSLFKIEKNRDESKDPIEFFDFSQTISGGSRFCTSFVKDLRSYFHSYPSIFASYNNKVIPYNEDHPVNYFLNGRDFLMDLCTIVDILSPVSELMIQILTGSVPPWKITVWFPRLLKYLRAISDDLKQCIENQREPSQSLFPFLYPNWNGIIEEKRLYDESQFNYRKNILKTKVAGSSTSTDGTQNDVLDDSSLIKIRDMRTCMYDYVHLVEHLRSNLCERYKIAVCHGLRELRQCFDLEDILGDIISAKEHFGNDKDDYLKRYYEKGFKEFESFYNFLMNRPHLSQVLNGDKIQETYRNWKELVFELIWKQSHIHGTWFVNIKNERLKLSSEIKLISRESEEGITFVFYKLILADGTSISDVKFSEDEFMKYIVNDEELLNSPLMTKELNIIMDYVHSTFGTEIYFDSVYSILKAHERDGGSNTESLIDRTIVDCLYPTVIQCPNTLDEIAADVLNTRNFYPIHVHKSSNFEHSKVLDRISKVPMKFPFILNQKDVKK